MNFRTTVFVLTVAIANFLGQAHADDWYDQDDGVLYLYSIADGDEEHFRVFSEQDDKLDVRYRRIDSDGNVTRDSEDFRRSRIDRIVFLGDADHDFFSNLTEIDCIASGGDGPDFLEGGDGDDELYGDGGDDKLFGEPGDDVLSGGSGDDKLWGGAGNDELRGGTGLDSVLGGLGDDELDAGDDVIEGFIDGGPGNDCSMLWWWKNPMMRSGMEIQTFKAWLDIEIVMWEQREAPFIPSMFWQANQSVGRSR